MTTIARRQRLRAAAAVSIALLLAAIVLSLLVGARAIAPSVVLDALLGRGVPSTDALVVLTQRIPRTVIGIVAGAALALPGRSCRV